MKNKEKTYSEALSEIESIISKLESGDADIDEITKEVKRASELINLCKQKLYAAEEELNNILKDNDE